MNIQEIFTRVVTHLLTQNTRALVDNGEGREVCRYRTPEGLSCAVGCLMKDEFYSEACEGNGVGSHKVGQILKRSLDITEIPPELHNLLCGLQGIHDDFKATEWPRKLTEYAEQHDLEMPQLLKGAK
jgi:hypothetical protein